MLETRDRVSKIKGIGETSEKRFAKLGIFTAGDLVVHYPFRYESYAWPLPIKDVRDGRLVSIEGIITRTPKIISTGRYKIIEADVHDDSGNIILRLYNSPYLLKTLVPGKRQIFRGKEKLKNGKLYIYQPEIFTKEKYREQMRSLKPVYKSTEGLNQAAIRKAIVSCFDELMIKDYLPAKIVKECKLPVLREALTDIHFPKNEEVLGEALRRMVFDEFFFFFVNMQRMKENSVVKLSTHRIGKSKIAAQIISELPYELTGDQKKALEEIEADLASEKVMQRLLQGDVGSGKTVVALLALAAVAEAGCQGAIMAPTEVLAEQHFEYFKSILEPKGIGVAFLSGSMTKKQKTAEYERIASGEAKIIVGTHAAIQEGVKFESLALAVIDEQHRFGVKQREALELKGEGVHLLLMSATPIPRTYALMLYGGMDISILAELPKDRLPIKNCVVDNTKRAAINRFLEKEVAKGHQGYVICPLIEESEKLEAAAVKEYVTELSEALPDLKIEALDGRMKAAEKILGAPLHHLLIADDFSAMMKEDMYREYVIPRYQAIFREFPHTQRWLHNDAKADHLCGAIADAGIQAWQHSLSIDLQTAMDIFTLCVRISSARKLLAEKQAL